MNRTRFEAGIGAALMLVALVACGASGSQTTGSGSDSAALGNGGASGSGGAPSDAHGPPPQAALDACSSAQSGDACSFTDQGRDLTGTCGAPDGKPLACQPDGAGQGQQGGATSGAQGQALEQGGQDQQRPPPPQEAIDACANLSSGDACSFTGRSGDVTGTCDGPDATHLACKPADAPDGSGAGQQDRQGPPMPPQEALDACASLAKGDACSFTGRNGEVTGTCDTPDATKPLACRPDDAPPPPQG